MGLGGWWWYGVDGEVGSWAELPVRASHICQEGEDREGEHKDCMNIVNPPASTTFLTISISIIIVNCKCPKPRTVMMKVERNFAPTQFFLSKCLFTT